MKKCVLQRFAPPHGKLDGLCPLEGPSASVLATRHTEPHVNFEQRRMEVLMGIFTGLSDIVVPGER